MIQGVIFDVDGTLFDSLSMWERVDQLYLDRKGVKVTPEISRQLFHLPLEKGALFIKKRTIRFLEWFPFMKRWSMGLSKFIDQFKKRFTIAVIAFFSYTFNH